jgi:hypothetical protein
MLPGFPGAKGQGCSRLKIKYAINSIDYKNIVNKSQETPVLADGALRIDR